MALLPRTRVRGLQSLARRAVAHRGFSGVNSDLVCSVRDSCERERADLHALRSHMFKKE